MMNDMKKVLMAVAAVFALTACNEELGPEYSTAAEFGEVQMTPVRVTADDAVSLEVVVRSTYGISAVQVAYFLNDDITDIKSSKPTLYPGHSQTSVVYKPENVIPAQEAGTKVSFQIVAQTSYNVISGTRVYHYTVIDGEEEPIEPAE